VAYFFGPPCIWRWWRWRWCVMQWINLVAKVWRSARHWRLLRRRMHLVDRKSIWNRVCTILNIGCNTFCALTDRFFILWLFLLHFKTIEIQTIWAATIRTRFSASVYESLSVWFCAYSSFTVGIMFLPSAYSLFTSEFCSIFRSEWNTVQFIKK